MKSLLAFVVFTLCSLSVFAHEIDITDTGTFELLDINMKPTKLFYRLSLSKDGEWIMDGKQPGKNWENISCHSGCEYRKSTNEELHMYFPQTWFDNSDMACIQNIAQAFCHFSPKNQPYNIGYVVVALITGKPIPLLLRRAEE